jgi:hypothetical protein
VARSTTTTDFCCWQLTHRCCLPLLPPPISPKSAEEIEATEVTVSADSIRQWATVPRAFIHHQVCAVRSARRSLWRLSRKHPIGRLPRRTTHSRIGRPDRPSDCLPQNRHRWRKIEPPANSCEPAPVKFYRHLSVVQSPTSFISW